MKKRTLALIMALVLMLSVAIPGTLAVSLDASSTETTFSLDTEAPAPIAETPAEEEAEPVEEAPAEEAAPVAEEPVVETEETTEETEESTEETEEPTEETEETTEDEEPVEETEESTEETEEPTEETEEPTEETEEPVEEVVTETVSRTYTGIIDHAPAFTNAGSLIVYDTPALMSVNEGIMLLAEGDDETTSTPTPTTNTSGLELDKKATYNDETGEYTITLEAYATGESVTTYVKDGVDIVLMLDLSQYMGKATTTETETTVNVYTEVDETTTLSRLYTNSQSETVYYYKSGDDYYEVDISWTESGGGGSRPAPPSEGKNYTYSITYTNNGTTNTIVSGNDGDTQLKRAGNYSSPVTLYTRTTETETITTTTYDTSDLTKLTALKTAVNNFIDKVHADAPASRIAIVTYAANAEVKSGTKAATEGALVTVNDVGVTELKEIVNGLTILGGASNSHYAAADAVKIFQAVPTTSEEYNRERVAILFSAGIPGDGWTTSEEKTGGKDIAQATMHLATILKTKKGTNAILSTSSNFDGGKTWSDSGVRTLLGDSSTWQTGCGSTVYCVGLDIPSSGDPAKVNMKDDEHKPGALANEYFWRISSHRLNGSHIFGSEAGYTQAGDYEAAVVAAFGSGAQEVYNNRYNNTSYGSLYYFYPDNLTRNQTNGYYLTTTSGSADDLAQLNTIFTNIAGQATTNTSSSTTLDSSTVIKDIITPQFQLPDGATAKDITVEVYDFDGMDGTKYTFKTKKNTTIEAPKASISEYGTTVSVTGFDFSANWCGSSTDQNGQRTNHGSKLVISFKVVPKEGFLGGNNVITNDALSGVYERDTATTPVDTFPRPEANVTIKSNNTIVESNVYLGGYYGQTLTGEDIKKNTKIIIGGVPLDLSEADSNYGLEDWQTKYVNITVTVKDKDKNVFEDITNLTDDVEYTVIVNIAPKEAAEDTSVGTANDTKGKDSDLKGKINVFTPELTFKDSEVYYGDTAPTSYDGNLKQTRWVHYKTTTNDDGTESKTVDKVAGNTGVTMLEADPPTLTLSYTPDATKIEDGKINSKNDIPVDVKVKIGNWDVTNYVSFIHTKCNDNESDPTNGKFWLHVKTCSLTITKAAGANTTIGNDEYFVFNVKKGNDLYTQVVIQGTGSVTLSELPVGTYTVEEDTDWSWRYSSSMSQDSVTLSKDKQTETITCTNTIKNNKWLDGDTGVVNTHTTNKGN